MSLAACMDFVKGRRRFFTVFVALFIGVASARTLYTPGVIGYVDDWNVPASSWGLWRWGIADFSPWRPIEYGMPLAYATEIYLKLALGLFGLAGISPQLVIALFVTACIAGSLIGVAWLVEECWGVSYARGLAAGILYATSPVFFNALIPGYITFLFAYAVMPWSILALLAALRGRKGSWCAYAFFVAMTLTQIQFIVFDVSAAATILIGSSSSFRQWIHAIAAGTIGTMLPYSFIIVNAAGVGSIVGTTMRLSEHSWISNNAPGLLNAFMLVPSAYSLFDQSLGGWNILWRIMGIVVVAGSLYVGFASPLRIARALAVLLVGCLVLLYGDNPPLTGLMSWFRALPVMALLRNINYVFALVVLLVSVLAAAPHPGLDTRRTLRTAGLVLFALLWAKPFLGNAYAASLKPVSIKNPPVSVVGDAERTLVLPHLQVTNSRSQSDSGMNPNSVETITPNFVRDTPTGMLEASILDRLTDWSPHADTLSGALSAAKINAVTLQTSLGSSFPRYVNSYRDLWLLDSYKTSAVQARLNANDNLQSADEPGATVFRGDASSSAAQTSDAVFAADGGVEDEIALRAMGISSLFVPADQITGPASARVHGLVRDIGSPEFLPTPEDVSAGAYVRAGLLTDQRTPDFHEAWVDPMDSSNWWLTERLLSAPHVAITDKVGSEMIIAVPEGRRHIRMQYYMSRFGGSIAVSGVVTPVRLPTFGSSLGEYRWVDLGTVTASPGAVLRVTSSEGFNGIGAVSMFTAAQEGTDHVRFSDATRMHRIEILPNVTFDEAFSFTNTAKDWRPSVMLANPTATLLADAEVKVERSSSACTVFVGNAMLEQFAVSMDGTAPTSGTGAFFPIATAPCDPGSGVSLNTVPLSSAPCVVRGISSRVQVRFLSAGREVNRMIHLPFFPLAFPALRQGEHLFRMSYPELFPAPGAGWSEVEDAQEGRKPRLNVSSGLVTQTDVGVRMEFATTHHAVDRHIALRKPIGHEDLLLVGSATSSNGASMRIVISNGKKTVLALDLPGDGNPHDFHLDLAMVPRSAHDLLYAYLIPQGFDHAEGSIRFSTVPNVSANLILMEPNFSAPKEMQVRLADLHFQRFGVRGSNAVVQYDQTFDQGWEMPGAIAHYQSASGFNTWVWDRTPGSAVIAYKTGMAYTLAALCSLLFTLALGALSLRYSVCRT